MAELDVVLGGGVLVGDNIVWVTDPGTFEAVDAPLLQAAVAAGAPAVYFTMRESPDVLANRLGAGVTIEDARPGTRLADPLHLIRAVVAHGSSPGARIVMDDFDALVTRLGTQQAVQLFTRTCPILFDLGAIAYWRMTRAVSAQSVDVIRKMTQCVLEVRNDQLQIVKAERRPYTEGTIVSAHVVDGSLQLGPEKALGRLAAGLRKIRSERGLSQGELSRLAGVSPSAISQAEAGIRGLGLDTVLRISQNLRISIDDLLNNRPAGDYLLARRDTSSTAAGLTPLFDDARHGLRGYLIELGPSESGSPPQPHKDVEAILVLSGLVKVDLGVETPVLRAGDAVLATRVPVHGWTNLLTKPSSLFWVLREAKAEPI